MKNEKINIPTSFLHVKGYKWKSQVKRCLQENGTSTGVGGKECEVIIFMTLNRKIMHPTILP